MNGLVLGEAARVCARLSCSQPWRPAAAPDCHRVRIFRDPVHGARASGRDSARQHVRAPAREHDGTSGFRIITVGVDGFLTRAQMIDAAERTLDLQYFIFRGDETGRLLTEALLHAADRGVRVRVLVDDGATIAGRRADHRARRPSGHRDPDLQSVRVSRTFQRAARPSSSSSIQTARLSNAQQAAGRRQRCRADRRTQHRQRVLPDGSRSPSSPTTTSSWPVRSRPSCPRRSTSTGTARSRFRRRPWRQRAKPPAWRSIVNGARASRARQLQPLPAAGIDYVARIATGEPYAGMISGRLPLVWAHAQVVCDSPDKKNVESGARPGRLMTRPVAKAAGAVQSELLMVTPYFVPADEELQLLKDLRSRNARVRVLTNSLESSGRARRAFRLPALSGAAARGRRGAVRGALTARKHQGQRPDRGRIALRQLLAAREAVCVRSSAAVHRLDELRPALEATQHRGRPDHRQPGARAQTAARFDAMAQPANSYVLALAPAAPAGRPRLVWKTLEDGKPVEYTREPARSDWQRLQVHFLSMLPLDAEL